MKGPRHRKITATAALLALALAAAGTAGLLLLADARPWLRWMSATTALAGLAALLVLCVTLFRRARDRSANQTKHEPQRHDVTAPTAGNEDALVKGMLGTIESLNRNVDSMVEAARTFSALRKRQRDVNDAIEERDATHGDKRPLH